MALGAVCAALFTGAALAQKTPVVVYTAIETDQMKMYKDAFEKANANVDIQWVRHPRASSRRA